MKESKHKSILWGTLLVLIIGVVSYNSCFSKVKASTDTPIKTVMYVEVNNNEFNNVGKYTIEGTTKPAFDIGVIFAANINYNSDTKKAYLYFNDHVQRTLDEAETQIQPVQKRGTKVLLSILGNHQGAGISNFNSYQEADEFALEINKVIEKYNLDGVDFDDEYADYGNNGTSQPNNNSFIWLLEALRNRLEPGKLITLYDIGPASYSDSNPKLSQLIDYAWNAVYGSWNPPQIVGMPKSRLSAAATEVNVDQDVAVIAAQYTKEQNYGLYFMYNLPSSDSSSYISSITQELYGKKVIYDPKALKN